MLGREEKRFIAGTVLIFMAGIGIFLLFFCAVRGKGFAEPVYSSLIVFSVIYWGNACWGMWQMRSVYRKIDCGEDILAEMIGETRREHPSGREDAPWECRLSGRGEAGSISRLYERIWEMSQIFRDREQQQKREQAYLRDLMSDISHQMKTPLAALQVYMDIFEKEFSREAGGSSRREKLCQMGVQAQEQMERMRWLVTGMLKLAQVESGMLRWDRKRQPVWPVLQKSADALQTLIVQKHLKIEWMVDTEAEGIFDAEWLQEAFVNIMKNACEYSPDSGTIRVQAEQVSSSVRVSVTDRGKGIPREEIPKIFNRFYRIPGGSRDGVGIGLALAKGIIEAQGGIITAYSQTGENSYTQFVMVFLSSF